MKQKKAIALIVIILRSGKRYTGKVFYDRAAIEITCHNHSAA